MTGNRFVRFAAALSVLFSVLCLSASAQNGARVVEPWIHPGWIGGVLGSTVGILGGVVGNIDRRVRVKRKSDETYFRS